MDSLISQGAEGRVWLTHLLDRDAVMKERLVKKYRHAELDRRINKQRAVQEARCMAKCWKMGVTCPAIYMHNISNGTLGNYKIYIATDYWTSLSCRLRFLLHSKLWQWIPLPLV